MEMNDKHQNDTNATTTTTTKDTPGEVESRFELLCTVGQTVEATSASVEAETKQPDYFDEQRFKRAQATCKKYYTNISMASTVGLILLVQIKSILIPLCKTGKSRTVLDLYDRYTATARYTRKYYETNIYDKSSEGWRYIKLVRLMHQRIHKLMNDNGVDDVTNTNKDLVERGTVDRDSENIAGNRVWVNQYDMALTQFAFIGLFVLRPDKCGAHNISEQELSDVVYYWRLISYYFGIEDRFNLFVYHWHDDENNNNIFSKQIKLLNLVLEHMKHLVSTGGGGHDADGHVRETNTTSTIDDRHPVGLAMARGILLIFEDLAKEANFNVLDHWWHPYVSLSGGRTKLTLDEEIKRAKMKFIYNVLFRNAKIMAYINEKYKKKFDKFVAKSDKNKKKLEKKYGHLTYELSATDQQKTVD